MDSFQQAELRLTAAYFLNYHRPGYSHLLGKKELWEEFRIEIDDKIRYAVLADMRKNGSLYVVGNGRAHLTEAGYKPARHVVLRYINGSFIDVDWSLAEVSTDGTMPGDFPLPLNWKWTVRDKSGPKDVLISPELKDELEVHRMSVPDRVHKSSSEIDWSMWGAIIGAIGVFVAIVAIVVAG